MDPLLTLIVWYPQLLRISWSWDILSEVIPGYQPMFSFQNQQPWMKLLKKKNFKIKAAFEFLLVEILKRFQQEKNCSPTLNNINHLLHRAGCTTLNHLLSQGLFEGSFNVALIRAGLKQNRDIVFSVTKDINRKRPKS